MEPAWRAGAAHRSPPRPGGAGRRARPSGRGGQALAGRRAGATAVVCRAGRGRRTARPFAGRSPATGQRAGRGGAGRLARRQQPRTRGPARPLAPGSAAGAAVPVALMDSARGDGGPEFSASTRLLVIAPHPDDETLATGVLLQQVLAAGRSEEHTSELQSHVNLVCRLLLEKKKKKTREG